MSKTDHNLITIYNYLKSASENEIDIDWYDINTIAANTNLTIKQVKHALTRDSNIYFVFNRTLQPIDGYYPIRIKSFTL